MTATKQGSAKTKGKTGQNTSENPEWEVGFKS